MSFLTDRAGWTDDEIAAGVHIAAALGYWPGDDDSKDWEALDKLMEREWHLQYTRFDCEGAELLISQLSTTAEIRTRLSQYILEGEKEQIAERYANRERLPAEFRVAALRSDAVPILVKSFLASALEIYPALGVNREILGLAAAIRLNSDRRTVYARVSDVQKYIHRKADEAWGHGRHLDLDNTLMRYLLSTSRLHIGMQDMFAASTTYWGFIWDAEVAASIHEAQRPDAGFIPDQKRRIRLWRVPQMKPLSSYASPRARAVLQALAAIPSEAPIEDYRSSALSALHAEPVDPRKGHEQSGTRHPIPNPTF